MDAVLQITTRVYLTNVLLTNSLYQAQTSTSLLECTRSCVQILTCGSFFYNRQTSLCLLQRGRLTNSSMLTSVPDYNYYWLYSDYCLEAGYVFLRQAKMCVKVFTEGVSWASANEICLNSGARMVRLDTEVKYEAVVDDVTSNYPGLTLNIGLGWEDGAWRWSNGNELTFVSWASGQPTLYATEYCVNLVWEVDRHRFCDDYCYFSYGYICEIVMEF